MANSTHMPSRTISMTQQVATVSRQAMVDKSRQVTDSKVDTISNQWRMDNNNKEEDMVSKLVLLHGRKHRHTQAATMPMNRGTMHMV